MKKREGKTEMEGRAAMPKDAEEEFAGLSVSEAIKRTGTSVDGLKQTEAENRLAQYGYNELIEHKESPLLKFLSYFKGPIPGMIMAAAVISGILRHWPDLGVILGLLVMNAVVGFREEYQADSTIASLKENLAVKAKVKRDGKWQVIPARELVPGDIVRLRIGDIIPADVKLLEGDPIQVDQSALTGESLPAEHESGDIVYSGSIVKQGEIDTLIYATGQSTYYGKTAELVESAKTQSHLQRAVLKIADYLIVIALVLAAVVIAVSIHRGDQLLTVLRFALILTVAAIPVAMPAVLSVTMALGARVLARMKAIVTHLPAVEELAGIDVLCSDKTGTLTKAELTLGEPFVVGKIKPFEVIQAAALASRAEDQDPIDLAVLSVVEDEAEIRKYQVLHFQPFDPVHKRTESLVEDGKKLQFKVSKGAPQVIMALDPKANQIKSQVDEAVNGFAARGYRSLGVARTDNQGQWKLIGILPLYDPPRDDSKATVHAAKEEVGIDVKMVTGDQIAIAKEIGRQLDLGTNIMNADAFGDVKHHEASQLANTIEQADGFAQVFPEHKYHIVDVLQQRGHIVGMTGDGVNDAPALKKADAGIAVSGATDAARSAADIVLLLPGLSIIVDAIKESRRIFQRMINYATYRIAETVALLGFLAIAILAFEVYPVTAIMIVLLSILNDFAIISIAYDNTSYSNKPETWNMRLVMGAAIALGVFALFRSFGIFYLGDRLFQLDSDTLRTLVYLNLSIGGHLTVFAARTRGAFWSIRPSRILLGAVFGTQAAATFIAVNGVLMHPISWQLAGIVWGYCGVLFLLQDRIKLFAYQVLNRYHSGFLTKQAKG